jgi:hypothetical protein
MLRKSELSNRIAPTVIFVAILLGLVTFGIASALTLVTNGVSHLVILLTANSLTGALVTLAYLQHRKHEAQRLQTVNENLQIMRDMNQEVRCVLGIVALYGKQTKSDHVAKVFEDCFKRMDFIMREVLSRATFVSQSPVSPPEMPTRRLPFYVWGELRRRIIPDKSTRAVVS